MNKAAFLDPRFKKFPHLSHCHLSTTQLDNVSISLKEEMEGLLQKLRAESATQESDSADVQIMGTSDSDKPPLKKAEKIHLLRKLLGEDFGNSNATTERSNEDQAQAELARYKAEPQMPLEQNPLKWWKEHNTIYPILTKLARKYLCLPSTSVPSECLFSISGIIINEKRAALDPLNVDEIVFLHNNLEPIYLNYARRAKKCQCTVCTNSSTDSSTM